VKPSVRKCKWKVSGYLKSLKSFFIMHLLLTNPTIQMQLLKALASTYLESVNVMFSFSDNAIICLANCIGNFTVNASLPCCALDLLPSVLISFPHTYMLAISHFAADWIAAIQLLLSGDVESNPGPATFVDGEMCYCYWGSPALLYKAKIIDTRIIDDVTSFLVHYVGYKNNRNEWVHVDMLVKDSPETELLKRTLDDRHRVSRKGSTSNSSTPVSSAVSGTSQTTDPVVTPSVVSSAPTIPAVSSSTENTDSASGPCDPPVPISSDSPVSSVNTALSSTTTATTITTTTSTSTPMPSPFSTSTGVSGGASSRTSTCTTDSVIHPVCATSVSNSIRINDRTCCSDCRGNSLLLSALQTKLEQHILMTDIKLRDLQESNAMLLAEITVLRSRLTSESSSDAASIPRPASSYLSNSSVPRSGSKEVRNHDSVGKSPPTTSSSQTSYHRANVTNRVGRYRNEIFGSSIIRDTGNLLNTPNTCVFPRGGARIMDIHATVNSLSEQAISETNSILFHVGGNDLHRPANVILQDYDRLLTLTKSRFPLTQIAVSAPLLRSDIPIDKVANVNCELRKLCSDYGVHFMDTNLLFSQSDFYDGIHLRRRAKIRLAGAFDEVLSKLVPKNGTTPVWNDI
jgi:RNA binding activity-knot of a chromodomain